MNDCNRATGRFRLAGDIDVVLDNVAGDALQHLLNSIAPGGRYASAGAIAGRNPTIFWPDFSTDDLDRALSDFAGRERRFGGNGIVDVNETVTSLADKRRLS